MLLFLLARQVFLNKSFDIPHFLITGTVHQPSVWLEIVVFHQGFQSWCSHLAPFVWYHRVTIAVTLKNLINPIIRNVLTIEKIWITCKSSGHFFAAGKLFLNGSQQDKATTPPSFCGKVNAEYKAKAPPWEKPPTTILSAGIPAWISFCINVCTSVAATLIPNHKLFTTELDRLYISTFFIFRSWLVQRL